MIIQNVDFIFSFVNMEQNKQFSPFQPVFQLTSYLELRNSLLKSELSRSDLASTCLPKNIINNMTKISLSLSFSRMNTGRTGKALRKCWVSTTLWRRERRTTPSGLTCSAYRPQIGESSCSKHSKYAGSNTAKDGVYTDIFVCCFPPHHILPSS